MPSHARWTIRTGLRTLGISAATTGLALGLVPLIASTPAAVAGATGTITLTPSSGDINDDPFAEFAASEPCPSGFDTVAELALDVAGSVFPLVTLEKPGLDENPPASTIAGSLAAIAAENGGFTDLPDGVFPLLLTCFDADFNPVEVARGAIGVTGDAWQVEAVDPTPTGTPTATGTPSPTDTASPTPSGSTPSPTGTPSPTPTEEPTPTPTPTDTSTPTVSPTPEPDGGSLPTTGTDLFAHLYVGLALIAAGVAALLWARRLSLLTRDGSDATAS